MGKKIVVVDDDQITIKIIEKFLDDLGFQVFTAEDGAAGYELVKSENPDILISDMLIPKIHGVELCRKIRENPGLSETKLILMTSVYKNGAYRSIDLECNRDGFLEKPLDFKRLEEVIESV